MTRTQTTSVPRYAASPDATPATTLSSGFRYSRFFVSPVLVVGVGSVFVSAVEPASKSFVLPIDEITVVTSVSVMICLPASVNCSAMRASISATISFASDCFAKCVRIPLRYLSRMVYASSSMRKGVDAIATETVFFIWRNYLRKAMIECVSDFQVVLSWVRCSRPRSVRV